MKFKAVVIDLDGTVYDSKGLLSEYTRKILQTLHYEKGIKVFIATGRNVQGAEEARKDIGLNTPVVTGNGSKVYGDTHDQILHADFLDYSVVEYLVNYDVGDDVALSVIADDLWYAKNVSPEWRRKDHKQMLSASEFKNKNVTTVSCASLDNLQKIFEIEQNLLENFGDMIEIVRVLSSIEISAKGCSKLSGVLKVLELHGINPDEVIAFGDSFNDFEMLRGLGKGVLMGNAMDNLKQELSYLDVTLTNDDDGVAKYLANIFKL
ncbi:MAG: HAD family hydrolase [Fusobacteriaceae bacterium]